MGIVVILVYALSLFVVFRNLYMCATTEPGVIPGIRAKVINYARPYKVLYDKEKVERSTSSVQAFFSPALFRVYSEADA